MANRWWLTDGNTRITAVTDRAVRFAYVTAELLVATADRMATAPSAVKAKSSLSNGRAGIGSPINHRIAHERSRNSQHQPDKGR